MIFRFFRKKQNIKISLIKLLLCPHCSDEVLLCDIDLIHILLGHNAVSNLNWVHRNCENSATCKQAEFEHAQQVSTAHLTTAARRTPTIDIINLWLTAI